MEFLFYFISYSLFLGIKKLYAVQSYGVVAGVRVFSFPYLIYSLVSRYKKIKLWRSLAWSIVEYNRSRDEDLFRVLNSRGFEPIDGQKYLPSLAVRISIIPISQQ